MEKSVVLVGQNGTDLPTRNFSKKKGITSDVSFLVFTEMTGISLNHLFHHTYNVRTMLLGEINGLFHKIASGKSRSIRFPNTTTVFSI